MHTLAGPLGSGQWCFHEHQCRPRGEHTCVRGACLAVELPGWGPCAFSSRQRCQPVSPGPHRPALPCQRKKLPGSPHPRGCCPAIKAENHHSVLCTGTHTHTPAHTHFLNSQTWCMGQGCAHGRRLHLPGSCLSPAPGSAAQAAPGSATPWPSSHRALRDTGFRKGRLPVEGPAGGRGTLWPGPAPALPPPHCLRPPHHPR